MEFNSHTTDKALLSAKRCHAALMLVKCKNFNQRANSAVVKRICTRCVLQLLVR